MPLISPKQPLPGFEDEAAGAVFVVFAEFLVLEGGKGLGREGALFGAFPVCRFVEGVFDLFPVVCHQGFELALGEVFGVQDVAELLAGKAVETGVIGVELGADAGAAVFVPAEGREGVLPLEPRRRGEAGVFPGLFEAHAVVLGEAAGDLLADGPAHLGRNDARVPEFPPHVERKRRQVPGGVDELQDAGDEEAEVALGVGGGGGGWETASNNDSSK